MHKNSCTNCIISPTKQKHSWLALKDPSSMLFLVQGWTFHHPPVVALQLFATASNDDMHRGARWRPESLGFGGPVILAAYPIIHRVSMGFIHASKRWLGCLGFLNLLTVSQKLPSCLLWLFKWTFWSHQGQLNRTPVWHHVSAAWRLANLCKESPICHRKSSVVYCTGPLFYGDQRTEGLFYFPRCWLQIGLLWCLYTISYIEAACSFVLWILTAKRISQIVTPRTLLNGHVKPKLRTIHLRHVRMHGHPNIKW